MKNKLKRPGPMWLGLGLGAVVALSGVLASRIPGGDGTLGADVRVFSAPSAGVSISPSGLVLTAPQLRPGKGDRSAGLQVSNRLAGKVLIRVRAATSTGGLDGLLWIQIEDGGGVMFRGPVGQLRSWTQTAALFGPGEGRSLRVTTWLPGTVRAGYEGVTTDVTLEWKTEPAGS